MGGIGGGGANGGKHPPTGTGNSDVTPGIIYTGSGGGGCGNQPTNGRSNGGNGIVIVKIKMQ